MVVNALARQRYIIWGAETRVPESGRPERMSKSLLRMSTHDCMRRSQKCSKTQSSGDISCGDESMAASRRELNRRKEMSGTVTTMARKHM